MALPDLGIKYRPDIDGLRAVAVLPVILYHLGIPQIPGGFVGVDVFFVISGYLITKILSADLDANDYSIARFYVRRARRIFPALFVLLVVVTVAVLVTFLPHEVSEFRNSLAAATLFFSNIYFYLTEDYFDTGALTRPLLHTWSLAVEEQFYIVFPILLWALRRNAVRVEKIVLAAATVASLAWSAWLVSSNQPAAFYLPQSRAWELLFGSMLALGAVPAFRNKWLAEGSGILGLALIAIAVLKLRASMPFPGLYALPPCLGAALIILSGGHRVTLASRLLSIRPARQIGLISYSWYLWHWPFIVLAGYLYNVDTKSWIVRGILFFGSGLVAWLSWRFVERPFRGHADRSKTPRILAISAAAMAALLVVSTIVSPISATLWKTSPAINQVLATLDYDHDAPLRVGQCLLNPAKNTFADFDQGTCLKLDASRRNVLLIGDSHAAHLWAGFQAFDPNTNFLQATVAGCRPIEGGKAAKSCRVLMEFMFSKFIPAHHFDEIILESRWQPRDIDSAIETAKMLKPFAARIVLFGPTVEYRHTFPRTLAISMIRSDPGILDKDRSPVQNRTDQEFARRAASAGVEYFSVYQAICPDGHCISVDSKGTPLQFDYGHLTVPGAVIVATHAHAAGYL